MGLLLLPHLLPSLRRHRLQPQPCRRSSPCTLPGRDRPDRRRHGHVHTLAPHLLHRLPSLRRCRNRRHPWSQPNLHWRRPCHLRRPRSPRRRRRRRGRRAPSRPGPCRLRRLRRLRRRRRRRGPHRAPRRRGPRGRRPRAIPTSPASLGPRVPRRCPRNRPVRARSPLGRRLRHRSWTRALTHQSQRRCPRAGAGHRRARARVERRTVGR